MAGTDNGAVGAAVRNSYVVQFAKSVSTLTACFDAFLGRAASSHLLRARSSHARFPRSLRPSRQAAPSHRDDQAALASFNTVLL
jgi:hypothetical protein